ncbi:hypothetical protein MRS44_005523 [Fusarium solani]|uniref:uncharacterized protein n=1 Tax=Fusarium solani TaxID=169388 RepID=UPI0032C425EE|nr:hypothetical protein MRS44_005523 [Fusarium solani]
MLRILSQIVQSRVDMCQALAAGIPSTVDAALADLEESSKVPAQASAIGPFSVLNFSLQTPQTCTSPSTHSSSSQQNKDCSQIVASQLNIAATSSTLTEELALPTPDASAGSFTDFLQWGDLFNWDIIPNSMALDDPFLTNDIDSTRCEGQPSNLMIPGCTNTSPHASTRPIEYPTSAQYNLVLPVDVLPDAPRLLTHFENVVVHRMSSLPIYEKSPWSTMHIPAAMITLSKLTLFSVDASKISYANIGDLCRGEGYWTAVYETTYEAAKKHLDQSLEKETQSSNKAKYKEQLMAMGSTTTTSETSAHRPGQHLGAEDDRDTMSQDGGRGTVIDPRLDDFFRLPPRTPIRNKDTHQEIHISGSGTDEDGLYMQIYGIPETWLRLLSQTTRLANEMDVLHQPDNQADIETFMVLQRRASQLEESVCAFRSKCLAFKTSTTTSHLHMLRALCSALLIYFYQRIRRVNPMILQSIIDDVIEALQDYDQALKQQGLEISGTAWPALIAGSEAESKIQRDQIMAWIDTRILAAGFGSYYTAKEIIEEVWARRDGASNLTTWMDVCRDKGRWPILA